MIQDLKITLIQTDIYWEDTTANLAMLEEKIWQIAEQTDLIVLPEMFNSGFSMNIEKIAEPMNMNTFKWMKNMAAQTGAVITGSCAIKEKDVVYNRLLWMQPDGGYDYYDKKHLFRMGFETKFYKAGTKKILKEIKGWKIMPLICYDIRFPVWSRNVDLTYDLLLYIASWPQSRSHAWNTLLAARAIENLSYVAGLNRIGRDGIKIEHIGESSIYDFKGQRMFYEKDTACVQTLKLSKDELNAFRQKFPAHLDADAFELY